MEQTYKTFLPTFPGFYETELYSEDTVYQLKRTFIRECSPVEFPPDLLEGIANWGAPGYTFKVNLDKYMKDAASEYADLVKFTLLDRYGLDLNIKFLQIESPREYNFGNDKAICDITLDPVELLKVIEGDHEGFKEYIRERFTPRSGFIPFYSDKVSDWLDPEEWDGTMVSVILEYLLISDEPNIVADLCERVQDYVAIGDYIEYPDKLEEFLESDYADEIKREFWRCKRQGLEYLQVMGNSKKYKKLVEEGMERICSELTALMVNHIKENYA